jgi:hypothetical protein
VSVFAAVILEGLDRNGGSVLFAKAVDELDFGMDAIIVTNETANKTDDDDWRGGNACRSSGGL